MDIRITPRPLQGAITAPPSKSAAHRALIAAALTTGESIVAPIDLSQDIEATIGCIEALGGQVALRGDEAAVTPVPPPPHLNRDVVTLHCGESGSTLRFMLPVCAMLGCATRFDGGGRLPLRPLGILQDLLTAHGCHIEREGDDPMPFRLTGRLEPGRYQLPGHVSSQYITGLLFVLPLLEGESEIILTTPLESAGYVEMTLETLTEAGISVRPIPDGYQIPGGQRYLPGAFSVEGDYSNAAFWLAAGALSPGEGVTCKGLKSQSTQGDRAVVDLLGRFGAQVQRVVEGKGQAAISCRPGRLEAIEIDVRHIPDLVPVLAVTAALAQGHTRIHHGERLRLKESDRITSTARLIASLGGDVRETPDGLDIRGVPRLAGGVVESFGDHRIVMAAAVAAIRCQAPVTILGAQAVHKSYPHFFAHYQQLGGLVHVL